MSALETISQGIEAEARRHEFPIDEPIYIQSGRDPLIPILAAGNPGARVCSFGRDLGRDEVRYGQPQVGAAGKLVRTGVLAALGVSPSLADPRLEAALDHVFLSNTAPYKPPGNKAYTDRVKERFRPWIARLLLDYWQGDTIITLGTEAFQWFAPYVERGAAEEFWRREDRYEANLSVVLAAEWDGEPRQRVVTVAPLPHPSPLNARWVGLFPGLLRARLLASTRPEAADV